MAPPHRPPQIRSLRPPSPRPRFLSRPTTAHVLRLVPLTKRRSPPFTNRTASILFPASFSLSPNPRPQPHAGRKRPGPLTRDAGQVGVGIARPRHSSSGAEEAGETGALRVPGASLHAGGGGPRAAFRSFSFSGPCCALHRPFRSWNQKLPFTTRTTSKREKRGAPGAMSANNVIPSRRRPRLLLPPLSLCDTRLPARRGKEEKEAGGWVRSPPSPGGDLGRPPQHERGARV